MLSLNKIHGFTLLEMLLATALAAGIGLALFRITSDSAFETRIQKAAAQLQNCALETSSYFVQNKKWPATLDDIPLNAADYKHSFGGDISLDHYDKGYLSNDTSNKIKVLFSIPSTYFSDATDPKKALRVLEGIRRYFPLSSIEKRTINGVSQDTLVVEVLRPSINLNAEHFVIKGIENKIISSSTQTEANRKTKAFTCSMGWKAFCIQALQSYDRGTEAVPAGNNATLKDETTCSLSATTGKLICTQEFTKVKEFVYLPTRLGVPLNQGAAVFAEVPGEQSTYQCIINPATLTGSDYGTTKNSPGHQAIAIPLTTLSSQSWSQDRSPTPSIDSPSSAIISPNTEIGSGRAEPLTSTTETYGNWKISVTTIYGCCDPRIENDQLGRCRNINSDKLLKQ